MLGDVGDGAGGGDVGGEGADESVFVAEVAVEGGDADVGFLGDLFHGDVEEARDGRICLVRLTERGCVCRLILLG